MTNFGMDYNKQLQDIEEGSFVVFDWDNTLKIYDRTSKTIRSRFSREHLEALKHKGCELFIVSAIAPRRLSLETLLLEVRKLGLEDLFTGEDYPITIIPDRYARKGNIIACGYDKAETFLELTKDWSFSSYTDDDRTDCVDRNLSSNTNDDRTDCAGSVNKYDKHKDGKGISDFDEIDGPSTDTRNRRDVVFFDDEEVNILNFRELVKGSICHHVLNS